MIAPPQRHTRRNPCPICEGFDSDRRGRGERCYGASSQDGRFAYCSREEYAGDLTERTGPLSTYTHFLAGPCRCGTDHRTGAPALRIVPTAPAPRAEAPKPPTRSHVKYRPDETYLYRALETGAPLRKLRYGYGKGKRFIWQRPDGAGDWIDGRDALPDAYGAEILADADPWEPLAIVEGEKDARKMVALGWREVISPPDGAGSWRDDYAHYATGRQVVIFADSDEKGEEHAQAVAKSVASAGALSVRIVRFEDAHDAGDWIDTGGTLAALRRLAALAPIITARQSSAQNSNPAPQDGTPAQIQKTCSGCATLAEQLKIAEESLERLRWKERMRERILAMPPEQLSPAEKPAAIAAVDILSQPKARGEDGMVQVYRAEIARRTGTSEKTAGAHLQKIAKAGIIRREERRSFEMSELRIAEGPLFSTPEQVAPQAPKWGGKRERRCVHCGSAKLQVQMLVCADCGTRQTPKEVDEAMLTALDEVTQETPPTAPQDIPPPSSICIVGDLASAESERCEHPERALHHLKSSEYAPVCMVCRTPKRPLPTGGYALACACAQKAPEGVPA